MTDPTPREGGAFEKWQGTANDFVVIDGAAPSEGLVRSICDRRRGVGADGVLVVGERGGVPSMVVLNADGSRPEMCGNGLRCVAGWLATRGRIALGAWTPIATDAGLRPVLVSRGERGWQVAIRMGRATFQESIVREVAGRALTFQRASMGNPHAICFGTGADELETFGAAVAVSVDGGVNAEFVRGEGKRFDVLVWERGVGPTQACGTGACAVVAVACRDGRAPFDEAVEVHLPGGPLEIEVARDTFEVVLRGPAERVFTGRLASDGDLGAAP